MLRLPVQQCAVIGDYGLLIILSDGVRLISIDCPVYFYLDFPVGPARLGFGIVCTEVDRPHDNLPE